MRKLKEPDDLFELTFVIQIDYYAKWATTVFWIGYYWF